MGALNPGDLFKDHKGVLLPLLAAAVIIVGLGIFLNEGGDYLNDSAQFSGPSTDMGTNRNTYSASPEMDLRSGVDYRATIETNHGDITVDLFEERAPMTVNNFVFLSRDGFYDDLTFHRVVDGFVIQGGDPAGNGTGGPGYSFPDEINPNSIGLDRILVKDAPYLSGLYSTWNSSTIGYSPRSLQEHSNDTLASFYDDVIGYSYNYDLESYPFGPGVVAMANSGPNTNGSQFFITVGNSDTSSLNGRHTVFGRVVSGMNVVDEISQVSTDENSMPRNEVTIERISIQEQ
ncbi:MAG: peptidylprolyl isomerase [Candidatus Dojkabacteria bacterium]|nr:peptidylprolyl isomerase [Candidatus Dojkabacteria bacterium]